MGRDTSTGILNGLCWLQRVKKIRPLKRHHC